MRLAPGYLKKRGYRLPTEAEWEYACRAGAVTRRYYGDADELLKEYAWYSKTTNDEGVRAGGLLKPNDLGLFDLYGNALEWTQDPAFIYRWPGGRKGIKKTLNIIRILETLKAACCVAARSTVVRWTCVPPAAARTGRPSTSVRSAFAWRGLTLDSFTILPFESPYCSCRDDLSNMCTLNILYNFIARPGSLQGLPTGVGGAGEEKRTCPQFQHGSLFFLSGT